MQRGGEGTTDSIRSGGLSDGFGSQRSMMSSIFGGRDAFDDPFFSRPFGSIFGSGMTNSSSPFDDPPRASRTDRPVIEELDTDDEGEVEEEEGHGTGAKNRMSTQSNNDPVVEHPEDQPNGRLGSCCSAYCVCLSEVKSKNVQHRSDQNKVERTQPHTFSFHKVTYGGMNGTYFTATTSRKAGGDGGVIEESKQADRTTGQAAHRISRGIHDKGHSVTRKLNSDGKVDTVQTLHNLNEDELGGFEQDWEGNIGSQLSSWNEGFGSFENPGNHRFIWPSYSVAYYWRCCHF
ncbi:hypothetical protein RJ640_015974 [Escallonia rubra]|uniref:Myeloid leukemia factor 1 n=1 Tax=Escallonia rubra TaxID=112253 RepID=A0AA88RXR3_9ASTE|nr:hypothetical protein RJ640_015974 [Escallonia rubra]